MTAPLILTGLNAGVGFAGAGIDIFNSIQTKASNLTEVEAQRDREAQKLVIQSQQRAADLAQGVGVVDTAAAAAGIGGASVGLARGSEVASGVRSQAIAEMNFSEQMRQLDFAAEEIRRKSRAEVLSSVLSMAAGGVGAASSFISDRTVKVDSPVPKKTNLYMPPSSNTPLVPSDF